MVAFPGSRPPTQLDLDLRLQNAIDARDGQGVYHALNQGANIDARRDWGNTPVMLATQINSDHILTQLLNRKGKKPDLTQKNDKGETALHLAAKKARTTFADFLIKAGAPVNVADKEGNTPLHIAAQSGFTSLAATCIEKGCDVNAPNAEGLTPLLLATKESNWSTARELLKMGASTDCRNTDGMTPLMYVAINDVFTTGLGEELLAAGADPLEKDGAGTNALGHAATMENCDLLKRMLKDGRISLAEAANARGETAFQVAVNARTWLAIQTLIELGAAAGEAKTEGATLLTRAVQDNSCTDETFKTLLGSGLDPEGEDAAGMTPLMLAAEGGREKGVTLLLQNKADVFHARPDGLSAVDLARKAGHNALAETLAEAGKKQVEGIADAFRTGTGRPARTVRKLALVARNTAPAL